ncbi:MAG: hypothetical protein IT381_15265 [Deltaproteobacteria bacterium]|nr:hypothetical protein [Deltaproteobacteria bacterium]
MPKGNSKFTKRLRAATHAVQDKMSLVPHDSGSLFSPVYRSGNKYVWAKLMDSDGLLLGRRAVGAGEGSVPASDVELLLGIVVQSEDATSQTKPNPLGKAALSHIPNGVWTDVSDRGRCRIDRVLVLFVLPKGTAAKRRKKFETAKRNVENAAELMPDAEILVISRGASAAQMSKLLQKVAGKFLRGRGRPALVS